MADREQPPAIPQPDVVYLSEDDLAAIEAHLIAHLGEPNLFHEIISDRVHLDLYLFEPTEVRPRLVSTVGMSAVPMADGRHAELMICLPADWPLDFDALGDVAFWPMKALKQAARAVHDFGFALEPGQTLAIGEDPDPLGPGTLVTCVLVAGTFEDPEFGRVDTTMGDVVFMTLIPITTAELRFKQEHGSKALLDKLGAAGIGPVVDPARPCSITGARP
ncbi:MAG TPA: suppressor of fused domain protein [Acidimicrobiales bacterium]|nr:suppressor of fused domain protein [Acidimicrobiales bacterium]